MRTAVFFCCLFCTLLSCAQETDFLKTQYTAKDLTAENIFSENIEGPNFDKAGNFFVVNYQKNGTIGLVHEDGTAEVYVTLPEGSTANAIQFDNKGNMLLADFSGHKILRVDPITKTVTTFVHNDQFNQPNDICINRKGQLFASDPKWANGTGQIWRIDASGNTVLLEHGMGTTNGIELSPDEKILYVNESVQKNVWAFDVDDNGNTSNKRLFHKFTDFGMDGMKCDTKGNLYVCRYGKGTVVILSPEGNELREVPLKGKNVSNITFGGVDGKTCFVTLQDRKCVEMFRSEFSGKKR